MTERQIVVLGKSYKAGTLDAMDQFHVGRRLAPLWLAMGMSFGPSTEVEFAEVMEKAGPTSYVLQSMSEGDCNYVLGVCLSVVQRLDGNQWAPILAPYQPEVKLRPQPLYQDINAGVMMRLMWEVVQVNLANFTQVLDDGSGSKSS